MNPYEEAEDHIADLGRQLDEAVADATRYQNERDDARAQLVDARRMLEHRDAIAAAWVLDRAEQYDNSDRVRAAFDEIMRGLAEGEHVAAYEHGELDNNMTAPFIEIARKRRTDHAG